MKARLRLSAPVLLMLLGGGAGSLAPPAAAQSPPPPRPAALSNLDFEQGEIGAVPAGWKLAEISVQNGYTAALSAESPLAGKSCVRLAQNDSEASPWGSLTQTVDAAPYRGRRIRLRAALRAEVPEASSGRLTLRVLEPGGRSSYAYNTHDDPAVSPQWHVYELGADVSPTAEAITIGASLYGSGRVWADSFSLETIGRSGDGDERARALSDRGLDNLTAFARLFGYVRYFHPSDAGAGASWTSVALAGVQAVEEARNPRDLARKLEELFRPLAPTLQVYPTGTRPAPIDFARPEAPSPEGPRIVAWRHHGVDTHAVPNSLYWSRRIDNRHDGPLPRPEDNVFEADLPGGVSVRVPLSLYADARGTLPATPGSAPRPDKPDGFVPSGDDRATRLADVVLLWNVLQHFYPYFDVVQTDWPATLRRSLRTAAADPGRAAFNLTLRRLMADLHDGHGAVVDLGAPALQYLPLVFDWIEDRLVVTYADPERAPGIERGSVVLSLDGVPVRQALAAKEELISAATPQYRLWEAVWSLGSGPEGSAVNLKLQSPGGKVAVVRLTRSVPIYGPGSVTEPLPEPIAEVRPGIFYLDLDRLSDDDFRQALPRLTAARGIVFDVRGYPATSILVLQHLIQSAGTSPRWNIPVTTRPDRQEVTFDISDWPVTPEAPRLQAKVAFLTDGQAISYAETFLAIAEAYKLGDIVGSPTAGTNGDINPILLPGGYTVRWTGLKVVRHDGKGHHGAGIQPTVPVRRTLQGVIAGRDEVLEKGIEIVSQNPEQK